MIAPGPPPGDDALVFLAWSRVLSPLVPGPWRAEAWELLGLPSTYEELEPECWSTFHVGLPAPPVPLLLHAALGRDGAAVREDWMRVLDYLGLAWDSARLPPDHLGAATEALAVAVRRAEPVLARELARRYLLPWCEVAGARLGERGSALAAVPDALASDLAGLT